MKKSQLISYINDYLKISDFNDTSKNGLQVDSTKDEIKKIGFAVDASTYLIDRAIKEKVDMMIVHHGMFWDFVNTATGPMYLRLKKLIKNDISFCGYHLPLDAHAQVGNNIGLIQEFIKFFQIKSYKLEKFGTYEGQPIGFGIRFKQKISIKDIKDRFCKKIGIQNNLYDFGNKKFIQSFCTVSGGALGDLTEAKQKDYDLFLSGEGAHRQYILAKELGQSILVGGHYETEVFGVQALAKHLEKKFKLKVVFLDEKY